VAAARRFPYICRTILSNESGTWPRKETAMKRLLISHADGVQIRR
jgi:hypothetical protein